MYIMSKISIMAYRANQGIQTINDLTLFLSYFTGFFTSNLLLFIFWKSVHALSKGQPARISSCPALPLHLSHAQHRLKLSLESNLLKFNHKPFKMSSTSCPRLCAARMRCLWSFVIFPVSGVFHRAQIRANPQGCFWNMDNIRSIVQCLKKEKKK
jgi:hypothetical protein